MPDRVRTVARAARRRPALALLIPLLVLLGAAAIPASAEGLGRLFFTPERRSALERQRQLNIQPQPPAAEGATLSVQGVVSRSSGRTTVWINGVAHQDSEAVADLRAEPRRGDPTRVVLSAGDSDSKTLRVGEALSKSSGETSDPLRGGQVIIHRPPGRRQASDR